MTPEQLMANPVDALESAITLLENDPDEFDFDSWGACACGFLYIATAEPIDGPAEHDGFIYEPEFYDNGRRPGVALYSRVIRDVAIALGYEGAGNPVIFVSDRVRDLSKRQSEDEFGYYVTTEHAIGVFRTAIEVLKDEEDMARRRLAAA